MVLFVTNYDCRVHFYFERSELFEFCSNVIHLTA